MLSLYLCADDQAPKQSADMVFINIWDLHYENILIMQNETN